MNKYAKIIKTIRRRMSHTKKRRRMATKKRIMSHKKK